MCRLIAIVVTFLILMAAPAAADPIAVRSESLGLHPADREIDKVGALKFRGGLVLTSPDRRFGGFSALVVSRDGARLTAVSDRGYWIAARLTYDARGDLRGLAETELGDLLDLQGKPIAGTPQDDAEAIAIKGDRFIVAFERRHRLWSYDMATGLRGKASSYPAPPGVESAPSNEGIEALTTLQDGRLLALTENYHAGQGEVIGWIEEAGGWRRLSYVLTGLFKPVGATTLPSGEVVVLERRYTVLGGVASRLARISPGQAAPGARIEGEEMAVLDRPLVAENFEGIDSRRGAAGETLLYVLSDDNYNPFQRTLLLMFEIEK